VVVSQVERIRGSLWGLAVGDALGAVTEGLTPQQISARFGRVEDFQQEGQAGTDDTEFTLFYAELLQRYGITITAADVARHWLEDIYNDAEVYRGAGFSEALALQNLKRGQRPPASGQHAHSWSDGLAMCAAVFGCVRPGEPAEAAALARECGQVSHAGEGLYGGMAVAAAVAAALNGADWRQAADTALAAVPAESWTAHCMTTGVNTGIEQGNSPDLIPELYRKLVLEFYPWGDLAPEAVGLAFGILAAHQADFRESVLTAVNLGRDTDTIAAICGAVSGALHGIQVIPGKWLDHIGAVTGRCIQTVAGQTPEQGAENVLAVLHKGRTGA